MKLVKLIFSLFLVNLSVPNVATAQVGDMMQFQLDEDAELAEFKRITLGGGRYNIYASGIIDDDAADRLKKFVSDNGIELAKVRFNSPGGSLLGGMKLGRAIRDFGFDTEVRSIEYEYEKGPLANCASACAYAFAGGVGRFFNDEIGRLGLHQFYNDGNNLADQGETQIIGGLLVNYLDKLGIDASLFAIASLTDKAGMTWLSSDEAVEVGVANNGEEKTTAEIKLNGGVPYLRIEQNFHDVTSRVLLMCHENQFSLMGGIVTNPDRSAEQIAIFETNYLEFDSTAYQKQNLPQGAAVSDSVIWLDRELDDAGLRLLMGSTMLGMWMENEGGAMRWGSHLDLRPVRANVADFIANCTSG